jgi:hypothetical protein
LELHLRYGDGDYEGYKENDFYMRFESELIDRENLVEVEKKRRATS